MNDSHDIDMPYHPGCKHRYIEHLDHNALIKRLNEIADEIYRLTQLCVGLQEQLVTHDGSSDAHRAIRESITAIGTRISTIKVAIDDSIAALDDKVDANYSALNAADGQIANRINSIADELEDIQNALDNVSLNLGEGITSTVSGDTPIITSTSNSGDVTLAELPSTHGKFRYKVEDTRSTITYTADNNSSGVPNYTATLLDETGNASFPRTVSATTFDGNATTATLADTANRLNNSINITIKDASGENTGSTVTTDLSSDVTLRLPATLKGTDITGTASKASADATGANIADTYVHKTNVNEEIAGVKTFNDGVKSNSITPKTHTGSTLGSNNTPYEHIYGTNINGTSAVIGTVTGNLNGNAATATKLSTARTINGTTFDGTTAITTTSWGTARNITIADATATNIGNATSVNGSGNVTLKLPSTIKATLTGNASTATKLNTTRKINNTNFDGSADITTNIWGTARNITIADATATNIGNATSVNGSGNVTLKLPSTIVATAFNGVASSAKKLNVARTINGTAFDGSAAITTNTWGYSRNFTIATSDGANVGASVTVDGSGDVTLKLPATINTSMSGNAATATKLKTARTINGTAFDGSANITTTKWGTARYITITDAANAYYGSAVSVDGSSNILLKLPGDITADNFHGNATTATKLKTARTINGTAFDGSANITTANWGTTRKITISDADGSHTSSAVSVNGSGNVTLKLPEHITARVIGKADTATEFYNNQSVTLTGDVTGTASSKAGWNIATTLANSGVTAGTYGPSEDVTGNNNTTISVPQITVDAKGRVTSVTNRTYTSVNTDTNADTKVTQTVTNDNACYPLLIANTASASHTGLEPTTETDEVRKAYNINVQARYGFIHARNSYNADNLKGSVAGGNRTSAAFYGSTYDGATVGGVELGHVDKYGNRKSRLYATNYITDGALAPDGTAVAATFDVGVLADGTKYLNTSAGWYCNVYPTLDNTRTLGTASLKWSNVYATTFTGDLVGNATTATKLKTARTINGTSFDGSANITTNTWGYSRNFTIVNSDGTSAGPSVAVDGSGDVTLKLPAAINASMSGNADTATKLKTARTINGTSFDGSANITTDKWGTARNIKISDADGTHASVNVSVNGSSDIELHLPASIACDNFYGTANDAIKLKTARTINGTSFDGSANITTDKWGTTRKITISDADGSHTSSAVSVNGSGNVTLKLPEHITARVIGKADTATEFYNNQSVTLTGDVTGTASSKAGWSVATTLANSGVTAGTYGPSANVTGNDNATISVPQLTVDAKGRVTSIANKTLTCKNTTYNIGNATTSAKGIMQVGNGLEVSDGVVSVKDSYVKINVSQDLNKTQINRALSNIGIAHVTKNSSARGYCSRLAIGNTQILYGKSTRTWYDSSTSCRYCSAIFAYPFINDALALGTPFSTTGDDNAACGVLGYSASPRTALFGIGSPDHVSRVFYGAIGQSFPLDENAYVDAEITPGQGWCYIQIPKENINLTSSKCYVLVDMFISSNAPGSDYIEFVGSRAEEALEVGKSRISNTSGFDGAHFTLGYDLDLSANPDNLHDDAEFMGYNDVSDRKLFTDPRFRTFKMASFIVSASSSSISGDSFPYLDLTFNRSLSSGVRGYIRVFYIPYSAS